MSRPTDPVAQQLAQEEGVSFEPLLVEDIVPSKTKARSVVAMNKAQLKEVGEINACRREAEKELEDEQRELATKLRHWANQTDKGREVQAKIERDMKTESEYRNPPSMQTAQVSYIDACVARARAQAAGELHAFLREKNMAYASVGEEKLPETVYIRTPGSVGFEAIEDPAIIEARYQQAIKDKQETYERFWHVHNIHATRNEWLAENKRGYVPSSTLLAERFVDDGTPQAKEVIELRKNIEATEQAIKDYAEQAKKLRAKFHAENKANGGAPPNQPKAKRARKE